MINKELPATSSLLRERNIQGVFRNRFRADGYRNGVPHNGKSHCLPNGKDPGFGRLCILFMEWLAGRGSKPRTIVGFCSDLLPFFDYIEEMYGITTVAGLERSHVEGYAAAVRTAYEAGEKTFTGALDANGLLSAVRMFCMYLQSAEVVAEDYGLYVSGIPLPESNMHKRKE